MAVLPSQNYVIQSHDGIVVLSDVNSGAELVNFDALSANECALAQKTIYDLTELNDEDKSFAHFWSGYFYRSYCQ